jgi:hypothetical protein
MAKICVNENKLLRAEGNSSSDGEEIQFKFKCFHHIKDDRTPAITHKNGKQSSFYFGLMQVGEVATRLKSLFVYRALVIGEKIAGLAVNNECSLLALFEVL